MITVSSQRLRLPVDVTQWLAYPVDQITSASPAVANGADLQFEFIFSYGALTGDANIASTANWSELYVQLKATADKDGLDLWQGSGTVNSTAFNSGISYAAWKAGTDQQAVVKIPGAANSLLLLSDQQTFWATIWAQTTAPSPAVTTASFTAGLTVITVASGAGVAYGQTVSGTNIAPGTTVTSVLGTTVGLSLATTGGSSGNYTFQSLAQKIPLCSFPIVVYNTGLGVVPPSYIAPPTYYTAAQSDARYVQVGTDYTVFALLAGATFTGSVVLPASQMSGATGLFAATKAYVDAGDSAVLAACLPKNASTTAVIEGVNLYFTRARVEQVLRDHGLIT